MDLNVAVRDLNVLWALGGVLARQEAFNPHGVSWYVDDNPAWPAVRTAAIQAALRKVRDYASALGGSLIFVEHVADVGLLTGSGEGPRVFREMAGRAASARGPVDGVEAPSLDTVLQEITAVIEARCRATGPPTSSATASSSCTQKNRYCGGTFGDPTVPGQCQYYGSGALDCQESAL